MAACVSEHLPIPSFGAALGFEPTDRYRKLNPNRSLKTTDGLPSSNLSSADLLWKSAGFSSAPISFLGLWRKQLFLGLVAHLS
jgi:hypothetical protein